MDPVAYGMVEQFNRASLGFSGRCPDLQSVIRSMPELRRRDMTVLSVRMDPDMDFSGLKANYYLSEIQC